MKPIRSIILLVTAVLLIHAIIAQIPSIPAAWSYVLWFMGSAMLIYMVWAVLWLGEADGREWEDGYWYSDRERIV